MPFPVELPSTPMQNPQFPPMPMTPAAPLAVAFVSPRTPGAVPIAWVCLPQTPGPFDASLPLKPATPADDVPGELVTRRPWTPKLFAPVEFVCPNTPQPAPVAAEARPSSTVAPGEELDTSST